MKAPKNDNYPQFWFGFALGGAVCGLAAVAMGTKQGRTILKKTMKYIEDVEGQPDQIHQLTDIVTTLTSTILEGTSAPRAKVVENPATNAPVPAPRKVAETSKKTPPVEDDSTLGSIIDKMRSITADRKMENKFFKKPTKK
jgi:uncharacterized protein YoxC